METNYSEIVLKYFKELAKIPRESGNEKEVSDFLVSFAKERNLEVSQDEALNVIIRKDASEGYEDHPIIALQGHMDMVCVKDDDSDHDFEKDPIKLIEEDGWIKADGTTLGADDGIGVAFIMAILDNDELKHGPIEAVITTEEETSMGGASKLDLSQITAKYLINIDSEEEGVLTIGCAGGLDLEIEFDKEYEKAEGDFIEVSLRGFAGGHSGMEIDEFRLNANKTLARLLEGIEGLQIATISGGVKRNAIPSAARAVVSVPNKDEAIKLIEERIAEVKNEYKDVDPKGEIKVGESSHDGDVLSKELSKNIIDLLFVLPNGLYKKVDGSIVTSSNLGLIEDRDDIIWISSMFRSEIDSQKHHKASISKKIVEKFGAKAEVTSQYSGWQREESPIIDLANEVWKDIHGDEMEIATTHGGLECGLFKKTLKDTEMISFGPDIEGAHSPEERVNIKSIANNYKFLIELLERI
ncbi:aminoacyl-histidine dipeptidase [uncultured Anaerococcus sp.]|uniref:aminoacyl-histidine dipeptidase n=1 Tax=uncultured Anaerococcus sp. TaxID=293428 RepID=UPI0025DF70FA|nr:aminoacyl-histidine dipeptidase [uncultured Anaerococcus sp.]